MTRSGIRRIHQSVVNVLIEEADTIPESGLLTKRHVVLVLLIDLSIHLPIR